MAIYYSERAILNACANYWSANMPITCQGNEDLVLKLILKSWDPSKKKFYTMGKFILGKKYLCETRMTP